MLRSDPSPASGRDAARSTIVAPIWRKAPGPRGPGGAGSEVHMEVQVQVHRPDRIWCARQAGGRPAARDGPPRQAHGRRHTPDQRGGLPGSPGSSTARDHPAKGVRMRMRRTGPEPVDAFRHPRGGS